MLVGMGWSQPPKSGSLITSRRPKSSLDTRIATNSGTRSGEGVGDRDGLSTLRLVGLAFPSETSASSSLLPTANRRDLSILPGHSFRPSGARREIGGNDRRPDVSVEENQNVKTTHSDVIVQANGRSITLKGLGKGRCGPSCY